MGPFSLQGVGELDSAPSRPEEPGQSQAGGPTLQSGVTSGRIATRRADDTRICIEEIRNFSEGMESHLRKNRPATTAPSKHGITTVYGLST